MKQTLNAALIRSALMLMLTLALLLGAMGSAPAHATITAFFSAGTTCSGGSSASYATGGTTKVSLCVTTTTEFLCGHTLKLLAANVGESGRFQITNRVLGSNYSDPNRVTTTYPVSADRPAAQLDFGGTTASSAPFAPTANQLLATFDLTPTSASVNSTYILSSATGTSAGFDSIVSLDTDGTCGNAQDIDIPASLTLNFGSLPEIGRAHV